MSERSKPEGGLGPTNPDHGLAEEKDPNLRIGKVYAESMKVWRDWSAAMRSGQEGEAQKLVDRLDELRPQANAEFLRTTLTDHGYAPDAQEVWVREYKTTGWGGGI